MKVCLWRRSCNFFYGIEQWLEEEKKMLQGFFLGFGKDQKKRRRGYNILKLDSTMAKRREEEKSLQVFFPWDLGMVKRCQE